MAIYEIDIEINSDLWSKENPNIESLSISIIKKTLYQLINDTPNIEISIVLTNNNFIQKLNKKYRKKNKPTNVLSFPMTDPKTPLTQYPFLSLGDIIIAYETIKKEAIEQGKTIENHFTHMLVHGCLHLLHYDHEDDDEAIEMEDLEIRILKSMSINNPYDR